MTLVQTRVAHDDLAERRAPLDRDSFPFRSRHFDSGDGSMHYVDEGSGAPIVLVHGTPTWSFLYRHLIHGLSARHRVVAAAHLGFGLSEKPEGAPYRPEDHARRLAALIEHLGLSDITLVVHDFGGPIGLSYAIAHPERVARLVLFNTWMWSLEGDPAVVRGSRIAAGWLGRFLYRRLNLSPKMLIPRVMGDRRKLTADAHRHYVDVFRTPAERTAPWVLARELLASGPWYDRLWGQRHLLSGKPMLLLWGMKDPAFGPAYLERWRRAFPRAVAVTFQSAGHFVQEEEGGALVPIIERFVDESATAARDAR